MASARLGYQPWKNLTSQTLSLESDPRVPVLLSAAGHRQKAGSSWQAQGVGWGRSFPRVPTTAPPQHKVLSLVSLVQLLQRSLPEPGRQKRAAPGWATLIVYHRNVPDARARGGRASGRRGGPGRQGGAAGGAGDEPGPEGPTRRSTGAVRPSSG